ncbi:AraC family transcriptional regulator [Paenibacillus sp. J2TS4]|uniref:helix-turn-helix transcriptional regulator n=1 Tax=Paenibacillus sp. J2TS4 TaxID=2807194 RepID=UPI001B07E5E8|nr:AraC family transcriptional regulator [Paenibacillus sp. J2TS4]GIP31484.1 hypothetical protein J2TS4_06940 [Paenibacillus sp. J2TS4]
MDLFLIEQVKRTGHFTMSAHHFHPYYEIYYLLQGERDYFIKDRTHPIKEGGIVFIDKYELHKTTDTGVANHERILLQFEDQWLSPFVDPVCYTPFQSRSKWIALNSEEKQAVEKLLFAMLGEYRDKPAGWKTNVQAMLTQLLILAGRRFMEEPENSPEQANPLQRKIYEIVEHINSRYMDEITLGSVAEEHYISPYYLSRKFKEVTGFTFVEYVNSVRIKEAQKLLRETDLKIIQIAEQVGYEQIAHFGRVFKQMMRVSPLEYRKRTKRKDSP